MLYRVIGPMGSGKTAYLQNLARDAFEKGKRVFVLVPEQASAGYERELVSLLGPECSQRVEVTNFSRLPNLVLRQVGGLARRSITEEEKLLFLSQVLKEWGPSLKSLNYRSDPESVSAFLREWNEARRAGLSPEVLEKIKGEAEGADPLQEKCQELFLIHARYRERIEGRFDDPEDEEMRLCAVLDEYPFFEGCTVIIDRFWDFTAPQEKLLRRILSQAEDTAISFVAKKGDFARFDKTLRAARRVLAMANEASCPVRDVSLSPKTGAPDLIFLRKRLAEGETVYDEAPTAISLTACPTAADQALFVANRIRTLVMEGARWRDFAVLCRGAGSQETLNLVLTGEGIPVFAEEKKPLALSPLATTILLAVEIATRYPSEEAVREYLNRALFVCEEEGRYLLEKYVATWSLSGRILLNGKDFTASPDGYGTISERAEAELEAINRARRTVFDPLAALSLALAEGSCAEKISSLVAFLVKIGSEKLLLSQVKKEKEKGNWDRAGEGVRTWNCVLERLSGIGRAMGDTPCSPEEFESYLRLALSGELPGVIPPGQDRVLLSSVEFARPYEAKYVFLVDLNAGVFPAEAPRGRLFSEKERARLSELGYPLRFGEGEQSDELFLFYLAASFAKKGLFLSYLTGKSESDSASLSVFGKRVKTLFPKLCEETFVSENALPLTEESAFSHFLRHAGEDSPLQRALEEYFGKKDAFRDRLMDAVSGKAFGKEGFSLREVKPYEGRDVNMSYSRMEAYNKCRFSYFAKYLLGATESEKARFHAANTGTFIHRVLEKVLMMLSQKNEDLATVEEKVFLETANLACDETAQEMVGSPLSPELEYRLKPIRRSALLILKQLRAEFAVSQFRPAFFEKELGDGKGYAIPLPDGKKLRFFGSIDRVDLYQSKRGVDYVRVVDYKLSKKTFRLEDVANGLNLQMLLYLFSLWNKPVREGGKGAKPAGVLYLSGSEPSVSCNNRQEEKELGEKPFFGLYRDGLFVDSPSLLKAQDPDGNGEWIPKKKPNAAKCDFLISLEKLGRLRRKIESELAALAQEIREGKIEVNPLYHPTKADACAYCPHLPICKRSPETRRPYRTRLSEEDIFGKEKRK